MHAGAAQLPVVAGAQPAGHLLEVGKRPLEVAAGEDDAALGAHVDHLVGVGEAGLDRLVGGDSLDPRLGAGDHRFLYVLAGQDDGGDVGHDFPVHGLGVRVEGLDSEAFPDRPAPLRVAFGNGDQLGIGKRLVHLGVVLAEASAPDDCDGVFRCRHVWFLLRLRTTSVPSQR